MLLSLCCIWLGDPDCKFQSMTAKRFFSLPRQEALQILSQRILHNFQASTKILHHCKAQGISGYRMSSSLAPLLTHPDLNILWQSLHDYKGIIDAIRLFGKTAKKLNIRISTHPSPYITLTSDNEIAVNNSIADLNLHAEIFDMAGLPENHESPINIHIRKNGDPKALADVFIKNLRRCSQSLQKRLVLENNDTGDTWDISNLHRYFYLHYGIPVTYDSLHRKFLSSQTEEEDFKKAYYTWGDKIPLFHFSEGKGNTRNHADFAESTPNSFGYDVMWDCELKQKNLAIKKIQEKSLH